MIFEQINFKAIVTIVRFQFTAFLMMLFFTTNVVAQVKFTTIISSKEIGRSDYVQVEFVVENAKQIEHLTPPAFPDFHIIEGPMQSSGMTIVNGNMSQYKGVSFILQPVKTGRFTIQGASADVDGKPMRSNPVSIEVNTNSSGNSGSINPMLKPSMPHEPSPDDKEYVLKPGEDIVEKTKKNLFVKIQVDKNSCYVGEPIVATYKLYSRLRSESKVTKHPSLNGFSVYDMIDPNSDVSSVETVNGKPFTVHIIRKAQLIPLQAGPIELSQVEVENTVHFIKSSNKLHRSGSLLQNLLDQLSDEETGDDVQQHITLTSKPLTITVKPLPETNKPAEFNGAVGDFSMDAVVDNKNISAQDAGTLKVTIRGSGNMPVVDAPAVQWPADVNVYGTTAKEDIDKTVAPMKGSKTFEYVFTPKVAGSYTIPAIQFSYFDPAGNSYKTLQSQTLYFNASAAKKQSSSLLKNILSANPNESITGVLKAFFVEHMEWVFAALILSVAAFYLWRHNISSLKKEEVEKQATAAAENLKKEIEIPVLQTAEVADPLLRTKRLLENGDHKGFYTELNRALWDALGNKFNLPASDLNKYNIGLQLKAKGWDDDAIYKLQHIFSQCEMNLYTPGYNASDIENTLQCAEHIIKYINEV